jgi:hypothetical protein
MKEVMSNIKENIHIINFKMLCSLKFEKNHYIIIILNSVEQDTAYTCLNNAK